MSTTREGSSCVRAPFRTLISVADLMAHRTDDWVLLDARFDFTDPSAGRRRYRTGHLPGAGFIDLDADLTGTRRPGRTGRRPLPRPAEFARRMGAHGVSGRRQVVVYDELSGAAAAARLWLMLRWIGIVDVAVLDGGFRHWVASGGATESGDAPARPADCAVSLRPELIATTDDVVAALSYRTSVLIDARSVGVYCGVDQGPDPDRGHIPGARCLPHGSLALANGLLKPVDDLRRQYGALGACDPGVEDRIAYCGSGVRAALHVLAMTHAGVGAARLYVGSWSEWTTDTERPAQTTAKRLGR